MNSFRRILPAALIPVLALFAACSNPPVKEREAAEQARFESYAGPPVDHITYLGRYDGWKPIAPDQVVVWTTPFDAFLLKVAQPCDDLTFAHHISITQSSARTIYTRLDFIRFREWKCQIQEIRPVDYRRMKADLRKEHANPPSRSPEY